MSGYLDQDKRKQRSRVMPKLTIDNPTDQLYPTRYGVPTLQLGDGATLVSNVVGPEGFAGICFAEAPSPKGVGVDHKNNPGADINEIGAYFQILTQNPKSLDVLIKALKRAKSSLKTK
jgi:hypothetical protein